MARLSTRQCWLPASSVRMSSPRVLQLPGRRAGPLLVVTLAALLCAPVQSFAVGCHDDDLNVTRALGEQWLLPNCGGVATCLAHFVVVNSCPDLRDGCKREDEGDPEAAFPRCCPRLACAGCRSEELGRYFSPGTRWTERNCVQRRCELGVSGSILSFEEPCDPPGPPPSLDCELVPQDSSRGEHPLCCAHYRCPGLCRSGDRWITVGDHRADSCDHQRPSAAGWLSGW